MPHYFYKAKKGPSEVVEGEIEADNEEAALAKISASGLIPVKIHRPSPGSPSPVSGPSGVTASSWRRVSRHR